MQPLQVVWTCRERLQKKENQAQAQVLKEIGHLFSVQECRQESNEWSINSGCSNYMTKDIFGFIQLNTSVKTIFRLWNRAVV